MNPGLSQLQAYPFERLRRLLDGAEPPADRAPIRLSIGEPKHAPPAVALESLAAHLPELARYPATRGTDALRAAIADWLARRFGVHRDHLDPATRILPVNGTREALFAVVQALFPGDGLVAMPNPFYQIYEGATLLADGRPLLLPCRPERGFRPSPDDIPEALRDAVQLVFLCSPGNPTGAVTPLAELTRWIELADRHDWILCADECYSEIYPDEDSPPPGLLEACARLGRDDLHRCLAFHSLSKRSNLPGLRSGFVAGDPQLIEAFFQYRTYHGCAQSLPVQAAATAAWQDEEHVIANRAAYRAKFAAVREALAGCLELAPAEASFYLWAATPGPDDAFCRALFEAEHVTVLPGRFLSRRVDGQDPGAGRIRMALVAPLDECVEAARRIRRFVQSRSDSAAGSATA